MRHWTFGVSSKYRCVNRGPWTEATTTTLKIWHSQGNCIVAPPSKSCHFPLFGSMRARATSQRYGVNRAASHPLRKIVVRYVIVRGLAACVCVSATRHPAYSFPLLFANRPFPMRNHVSVWMRVWWTSEDMSHILFCSYTRTHTHTLLLLHVDHKK